jgi:hypothetical protein
MTRYWNAVALVACAFACLGASTHAATHAKPHAGPTTKARARATPRPRPRSKVAPADEYFGRLKLSVLGIRTDVKDYGLRVDRDVRNGQSVLNNAVFVEDAMRDWARKYPFDNWLPRYAYALEGVYEEIPGDDAHRRAIRQLNYIIAYFPQTNYAKICRMKVVGGIPTPNPLQTPDFDGGLARLALLDGKVKPTPPPPPSTPTPQATPTPNASASSDANAAPVPTPSASSAP